MIQYTSQCEKVYDGLKNFLAQYEYSFNIIFRRFVVLHKISFHFELAKTNYILDYFINL